MRLFKTFCKVRSFYGDHFNGQIAVKYDRCRTQKSHDYGGRNNR